MIDRREILEAASSFSLLPSVVERDYVLGWMLAGIDAHEELAGNLGIQRRDLPQKMLLRDISVFRAPGFYAAR